MEYVKSPLRMEVQLAGNNSPVRVINTRAYVYRRPVALVTENQPYWRPNGDYYVRYGGRSFTVTFDGNSFCMKVGIADFLRMQQIHKERMANGSSRKPQTTT